MQDAIFKKKIDAVQNVSGQTKVLWKHETGAGWKVIFEIR